MIVQELIEIGVPFAVISDHSQGDSKNLRGWFVILCEKDSKVVKKYDFFKCSYQDKILEYNLCKYEVKEFLEIKKSFKKISIDMGLVYEPKDKDFRQYYSENL